MRNLQELIARYTLEPSLRDLYVEGETDRRFFQGLLEECSLVAINVYSAKTVTLDDSLLLQLGLSRTSSKSTLIALAASFEGIARSELVACVRFLVDADFDRHLQLEKPYITLSYTDYSCLESYMLEERFLSKSVELLAGSISGGIGQFKGDLIAVLRQMFVIRLANELIGWNMTLIDYKDYVDCDSEKRLQFQAERYVRNYLITNGRSASVSEFATALATARGKLLIDDRHNVNGKDIVFALLRYLGKAKGGKLGIQTTDALKRVLLGFLGHADFSGSRMLDAVRQWVA